MRHAARVLHECTEITHDWLEAALGQSVNSFVCSEPQKSNWGSHVELRVSVGGDGALLRLRLKIASAATFGHAEVDYYTRTFVGLRDAPLVRCHFADGDATHYNLLLEDHSDTHRDQKVVEPTLAYGRGLVEAAAKLHAHHWPQPPPSPVAADRAFAVASNDQDALLAAMEMSFSAVERAIARRLMEEIPMRLRARLGNPDGFTWVHGDLNPTNVLAPINGEGMLYLIDHQPFASAGSPAWLGVRDLAYAIVVWWPVDLRRRWERTLVEHWHSTLVLRGVVNYSVEKAWEDWRLCGINEIHVPAGWCSDAASVTTMRWLWEAQLRRVLAFAADHT